MPTLGQLVRKVRKSRGLSRPQLAKLAGVHTHTIANMELDLHKIFVANLTLVAHALKVPAWVLIKRVEECPDGEIGRHSGLKIRREQSHEGSSPSSGTNK